MTKRSFVFLSLFLGSFFVRADYSAEILHAVLAQEPYLNNIWVDLGYFKQLFEDQNIGYNLNLLRSNLVDAKDYVRLLRQDFRDFHTFAINSLTPTDYSFILREIAESLSDQDYSSSLSSIDEHVSNIDSIAASVDSYLPKLDNINDYSSVLDSVLDKLSGVQDSLHSDGVGAASYLSSIDSKLVPLEGVGAFYSRLEDTPYFDMIGSFNNLFSSSYTANAPATRVNAMTYTGGTGYSINTLVYPGGDFFRSVLSCFDAAFLYLNRINSNSVYYYTMHRGYLGRFQDRLDSIVSLLTPTPGEDDPGDSISENVSQINSNLKVLFESAFSQDSIEYALISFDSNSVPQQTSVDFSGSDFFSQCLELVHAGVEVSASETMFLKHILERMPGSSAVDTDSEKSELEQSVSDVSSSIDSVRQSFEFSDLKFKDDVSEFFNYDQVFSEFDRPNVPTHMELRIPGFAGIDEHVVLVSVSDLQGFLDVSRTVFLIFYWCFIGTFVVFVYRLFFPLALRFVGLCGRVLNW